MQKLIIIIVSVLISCNTGNNISKELINDRVRKLVTKNTVINEITDNDSPAGTENISCSKIMWDKIDTGLYFAEVVSPVKSEYGDSKIKILKIDPEYYQFNLISSKEKNEKNKTVKEWADSKGLLAVINAGMFMGDFQTNTGFMKNYNFVNNGRLNKDNAILAFNRKQDSVPEIQIIDLKYQSWDNFKDKYNSYVQDIRMITYDQKNSWGKNDKKWSMASLGIDKNGNVLFIFTRSPYSVSDFIDILLELPLDIYNAMYLDGGPEASFYLNHNGRKEEGFGSYETGFNEDDFNNSFWKIPNIIGITLKQQK